MFCVSFRANFIAQQEKEAANRGFLGERRYLYRICFTSSSAYTVKVGRGTVGEADEEQGRGW